MDIATGLSGLRSAAELTRMLREGLKAGAVKPDEISGRIGEIYDHITDSKDALVDAKDEIEGLKSELRSLKEERGIADSLEFDGTVYWVAKGERWDGPFCSLCWDGKGKLVRLQNQEGAGTHPNFSYCGALWIALT